MRYFFSLALALALSFWLNAQSAPKLGEKAPPISLEKLLQGPDSGELGWHTLKGQAVVLEFWATWCGPCVRAIPHLNELSGGLSDQPIRFISISNEKEEVVKYFLERRSVSGWVALDTDRSMFRDYGVEGIPHTFLVDSNGVIRGTTHPDHVTEEALRELLAGKNLNLPTKRDPDSFFKIGDEGPEPIFKIMIRPSTRTEGGGRYAPGSITLVATSPQYMIMRAYRVEPERLMLETELPEQRYDVEINVEKERNLLYPLFQQAISAALGIEAKWEVREREVFVLRRSPDLKVELEPFPVPNARDYSRLVKGRFETTRLSRLVRFLSRPLGKHVIDETGLEGKYNIVLEFEPDDASSLIQAIREQLGLELGRTRRDIEILIVRPRRAESRDRN